MPKPRTPADDTVAVLFDFDAQDASQLSVTAGARAVRLSAGDADGWTRVRLGAAQGLVPTAYLAGSDAAAPTTAAQRPRTNTLTLRGLSGGGESATDTPDSLTQDQDQSQDQDGAARLTVCYRALYDYAPRAEGERSLQAGQALWVLADVAGDGDGWLMAADGSGLVPANHLNQDEEVA